jgi:superfamily II helicase
LAVVPEAAAIVAVGNGSGNFTLQYTRTGASALSDKLRRKGYNVQALHAGFTQPQRDQVTNSFRDGRLKLLVTTDVAAFIKGKGYSFRAQQPQSLRSELYKVSI